MGQAVLLHAQDLGIELLGGRMVLGLLGGVVKFNISTVHSCRASDLSSSFVFLPEDKPYRCHHVQRPIFIEYLHDRMWRTEFFERWRIYFTRPAETVLISDLTLVHCGPQNRNFLRTGIRWSSSTTHMKPRFLQVRAKDSKDNIIKVFEAFRMARTQLLSVWRILLLRHRQ